MSSSNNPSEEKFSRLSINNPIKLFLWESFKHTWSYVIDLRSRLGLTSTRMWTWICNVVISSFLFLRILLIWATIWMYSIVRFTAFWTLIVTVWYTMTIFRMCERIWRLIIATITITKKVRFLYSKWNKNIAKQGLTRLHPM